MNTMVIYDSLYGNTEKVAHAIGKAFSDAASAAESVAVVAVNDVQLDQLAEFDLLVVGGPYAWFPPGAAHAGVSQPHS